MNSESPAGGPLVIIGNSETALLAYEYFTHDSPWDVVGFCIGEQYIKEQILNGLPVVPLQEMSDRFPPETHQAFVAIAEARLNRVRTEHVAQARAAGYKLVSYVSSKAFRWHNVELAHVLRTRHNVAPVHTLEELTSLRNRFPENIRLFAVIYSGQIVAETGRDLGALDGLFDLLIRHYAGSKRVFDFGISTEQCGRLINEGLITQKRRVRRRRGYARRL